MRPIADLLAALREPGRTLLGYSGGVDSALLAVAGREALGAEDFVAVIGRSASYPEVQYARALEIARAFDVPVLEVATGELADPRYLANPTNRCYFCKSELWSVLRDVADERGFGTVIDGTNADDLGEHRPGLQAAAEARVRSPLAELGWSKADVRNAARELGIPIWDAPAAPCLSSRVRYGLAITPERLRQVERGEDFLRSLGVEGDLRVRHLGDAARIEALPAEMPIVEQEWDSVAEFFRSLGFADVELDPRGYRRGSLLVLGQGD
ncbi:MAG TPA: ATP-dependent sacrificial sulfur transferase LarE [Gemmatimonadales bacterium]